MLLVKLASIKILMHQENNFYLNKHLNHSCLTKHKSALAVLNIYPKT